IGLVQLALPHTYVVDTVGDLDDGNYGTGQLTLREAINLANSKTAANRDTIVFSATLNGKSITLSGTELLIIDAIELIGPGSGKLSISGNALSRIFNFSIPSPAQSSSISGVTLTRGRVAGGDGGAINLGTNNLTLSDVAILQNEAASGGGVRASGGSLI